MLNCKTLRESSTRKKEAAEKTLRAIVPRLNERFSWKILIHNKNKEKIGKLQKKDNNK